MMIAWSQFKEACSITQNTRFVFLCGDSRVADLRVAMAMQSSTRWRASILRPMRMAELVGLQCLVNCATVQSGFSFVAPGREATRVGKWPVGLQQHASSSVAWLIGRDDAGRACDLHGSMPWVPVPRQGPVHTTRGWQR